MHCDATTTWARQLKLAHFFFSLWSALQHSCAVATLSLSKALAAGPLALISPLSSGYSLVTILLALCFLHEVLSPGQGLTILVVLSGVVLTSLAQAPSSVLPQGAGMRIRPLTLLSPAVLFGLASMFGFGTEFFLQSLLSHGTGPLVPLFWSRLCSTLFFLASTTRPHPDRTWPRQHRAQVGLILLIGCLDSLGMLCYTLGAARGNAEMIALLSSRPA